MTASGPPAPPAAGPPPTAGAPAASPPRPLWRAEWWRLAELFALCGFVIVQPLLDVLGRSPDFFLFHGVSGWPVVGLVTLVVVVPPFLIWLPGLVSRVFGPRVRRAVHLGSVGLLLALLLIQVGKQLVAWRGWLLAGAATVVAALVWWGFVRWRVLRQVVRVTALGPLVFALLFAFASPTSALLAPAGPPAGGPAAATGDPAGPHPPVVIIVFDELPLTSLLDGDGRIDAQRFPHFAALASESTWWRNATAVAGWTPYALPAMLTGRYPTAEVAAHYRLYPDNLFTALAEVYRVRAVETISQLCPPWQCDPVARAGGGFGAALADTWTLLTELLSPFDPVRDPVAGFAEPTVAERLRLEREAVEVGPEFLFARARAENRPSRFVEFLSWLEQAEPTADDRPTLHFLHLLLPHSPWVYLPSGVRYEAPTLPADGPWWSQLARQRHLAQLEYTDRLLGETVAALRRAGVYDDILLVVTSDHGHGFTPGATGRFAPGQARGPEQAGPALAELAWVPLFIKEPGQATGVVDDRNWQHVDLAPTLADLMGVELPWRVDGVSWLRDQRTDPGKVFYPDVGDRRDLDGELLFARVVSGGVPALPPAPRADLVGRAVSGLPVVAGPVGAVVENAEAFSGVRLSEGLVPALVWGSVPVEAVDSGWPVAVAVNGRVGAVVPVVVEGGVGRFAALVIDESLFREGVNRVELFLVSGEGAATVLHRLG